MFYVVHEEAKSNNEHVLEAFRRLKEFLNDD